MATPLKVGLVGTGGISISMTAAVWIRVTLALNGGR